MLRNFWNDFVSRWNIRCKILAIYNIVNGSNSSYEGKQITTKLRGLRIMEKTYDEFTEKGMENLTGLKIAEKVSNSRLSAGLDSDELMASIQCYRVNYELNEWDKILKDNPQMSMFLGACAAIKFLCDELEKRI